MKTLLLFAVPPVAGALIGFVTNVIAIKMLFRPLREIRLFGIRLPFTPGILPRQRRRLADSIGRMVERELLTPDLLRQRFRRDDIREKVYQSVSRFTETALAAPLRGILGQSAPPPERAVLSSLADAFVHSPLCAGLARALVVSLTGDLNRSLFDILGVIDPPDAALPPDADAGDGPALARRGGAAEQRVERFIEEALRGRAGLIAGRLREEAATQYPAMAKTCVEFLQRDDTHHVLELQGRIFLAGAILKLNVFQRFFLSAAQYDRTLSERMPEIIDDFIGQTESLLEDGAVRRRLLDFLGASVERLFSDGSPAAARAIAGLLIAEGKKPLRELAPALSVEALAEKLAALPGSPGGLWQDTQKFLLEQYGGQSLGALLAIHGEKKNALDRTLCSQLLRLADEQIENVLSSVDVRSLVSERIDSLEMIRVERIILDVMADQFKWIDIFGAILGFLIGLFQALFGYLLR
ncbi:MAG: DUF445 family protein [Treponema sp.]|nr:DUF445 family protein [Treponema sp.]